MNNIFSAIMTKISGSALSTSVGGRVFLDEAPSNTELPYIVFFVVSDVPDDVFNKKGESVLVQFSMFSASKGAAEITGIYTNLKALFDDAQLTVTGSTMIIMRRNNLITMVEDITTPKGNSVKHWSVDYEIITQAS